MIDEVDEGSAEIGARRGGLRVGEAAVKMKPQMKTYLGLPIFRIAQFHSPWILSPSEKLVESSRQPASINAL